MNPVKPAISPGDRGPLIAYLPAVLRVMSDNWYLNAPDFTADTLDLIQQCLPAESEAACYGQAAQLFVARLRELIGARDSSAILAASAPGSLRSGRQSPGQHRNDAKAVDGCGFHVDDAEAGAVVRLTVTDTLVPLNQQRKERTTLRRYH